jgi:hypothetical protein
MSAILIEYYRRLKNALATDLKVKYGSKDAVGRYPQTPEL